MSQNACPVCSYANVEQQDDWRTGSAFFECPRCGPFFINKVELLTRKSLLSNPKLSAYIRTYNEQKQEAPRFRRNEVESLLKDLPEYTTKEKMLLFLEVLKKRAKYPGDLVEIQCKIDYPLVHASQWKEMIHLSRELDRLGYIENNLASGGNLSCKMLAEGEEHLEKHKTQIDRLVTFNSHRTTSKFLNPQYIDEQLKKCESKITGGDYEGAITNARTFLETILVEISANPEEAPPKNDGDLPRLFKKTLNSLDLNTSSEKIDENTRTVLRGLITTVQGLAELRNKMSDSHASEITPDKRHAQLAVNAAKTIACFLAESHFQLSP